jgi:hypothetical protein
MDNTFSFNLNHHGIPSACNNSALYQPVLAVLNHVYQQPTSRNQLQVETSFLQCTHSKEVLPAPCRQKCTWKDIRRPTQSAAVTQSSDTLSILPRTAAPFQARTLGSTSFGGGMICTFSIFGTSGVAIACNLRRGSQPWLPPANFRLTCSPGREPCQESRRCRQ